MSTDGRGQCLQVWTRLKTLKRFVSCFLKRSRALTCRSEKIRVLMVCLGNICRSPTAQGVLDKMIMDIRLDGRLEVDSAGTGNFHLSESPDTRAIKAALSGGMTLADSEARQINPSDYESFDLILAMDKSNLSDLRERCPPHFRQKLGLFLSRSQSG